MKKLEIVRLLSEEKNRFNNEVIEIQKSLYKANFAFITVAVAVVSIFLGGDSILDNYRSSLLFFGLSQVEYGLSLFCISQVIKIHIVRGYLSSVDAEINKKAKKKIFLFEHYIYPDFIANKKSVFYWSIILIAIFYTSIFVLLFYIAFSVININWISIVLIAEAISFFIFFFSSYRLREKIQEYSKNLFEKRKTTDT